jgi:iron complex transport system permease protein
MSEAAISMPTGVLPGPSRGRAVARGFALLGAAAVAMLFLELAVGPVRVPLLTLADLVLGREVENPAWTTILLTLRLPRILTAALAGAALGAAGLMMQTLFRNPLADPWFLGIVGGARAGVATLLVLVSFVGMGNLADLGPIRDLGIAGAAILGSVATLGLLSRVSRRVGIMTLLILGLVLDYMASGYVSAILHFSTELQGEIFDSWNDGSFGATTWSQLGILAALAAAGVGLGVKLLKSLNALLLGERYAESLGVGLTRARRLVLLAAALLAGGVTAYCGPVSFLGVIVPHLCRGLFRTSDHRVLLPAVLLMGSTLALLADFVTNLPWERHFLHLNAVNALIGGPVVLWVVLKRSGMRELPV